MILRVACVCALAECAVRLREVAECMKKGITECSTHGIERQMEAIARARRGIQHANLTGANVVRPAF